MNDIVLSRFCPADNLESGFVVSLKRIGLLSFEGDDVIHFLHGQLSNDIEHLGSNQIRLAAYCHPQGRILALLTLWKFSGKFWAALPKDILPGFQKRLQMYVLRARVKLADESDDVCLLGIGGKKASAVLKKWFSELPSEPFDKTENEYGVLFRTNDAFGSPRYVLMTAVARLQDVESALSAELTVCDENSWMLCDIESGLPQITLSVQDRFIPQMINLEQVGGLSFKKGCYPGQEVIARSQYRGTVKRRMFHGFMMVESDFLSAINIGAGMDVARASGELCGTIVCSARRDETRLDCLAVVQTEVMDREIVYAGSANGPAIEWVSLPYALPEDSTD